MADPPLNRSITDPLRSPGASGANFADHVTVCLAPPGPPLPGGSDSSPFAGRPE
jgi:hypothetical protein